MPERQHLPPCQTFAPATGVRVYQLYFDFFKLVFVTLDLERKTRGLRCNEVFRVAGYTGGERCNLGTNGLWIISPVDNPFTRDLIFSGGKEPCRVPPLVAPDWRDMG